MAQLEEHVTVDLTVLSWRRTLSVDILLKKINNFKNLPQGLRHVHCLHG